MKFNIEQLEVFYDNIIVGLLKKQNNKIYFQYNENWINGGFSISPLSLPLTNKIYTSNNNNFEGVFGVFYDSLPDGWGRLLINKYLNKLGFNFENLPILDKLSLTNKISKGGLTYKPCNIKLGKNKIKNLDLISKNFKNILENNSDKFIDEGYLLGGSSGGTRPKAYLTINNEDWLIKFPSKLDPKNIGIEEYTANKIAKECGINTVEFKLFPSKECKGYYGSKRFDKNKNKKLHVISLSSILETSFRVPNLDYLILFKVCKRICKKEDELYEVFKRMCFNILYENKDDHGNNFAFIYNEKIKSYTLSPFYDITKILEKKEHEMSLLGNGNPNENDILQIIEEVGLNKNKCINILENIKSIISKYKNK